MKLFKRVLAFLLAFTMIAPQTALNIVGATEPGDDQTPYTATLISASNGSMVFTDKSKNESTASQSGYQLVTFDENGNMIQAENDGSVWAFQRGNIVEVILTPDDGYNVDSFSIKDQQTGDVLAYKETTDNMFSFTMPGTNIVIESTFISEDVTKVDIDDKFHLFQPTEYHDITESDEMTRKEIEETELDIVVESYLKSNIDTRYTNIKKSDLVNVLLVKHTMFDGNYIEPNDTLISVMDEISNALNGVESGVVTDDEDYNPLKKLITQTTTVTAVYNLDDDSDYYVSYANTMIKDSQYNVQDSMFAISNNDGEVVDGCIYDKNTGLVYIPKELYINEAGNGEEFVQVQVQLMQVLQSKQRSDTIELFSSVYSANIDEDSIQVEKTTQKTTTLETRATVGEGVDVKNMNVLVNGLPIPESLYTYDDTTNEVVIYMPASSVASINVTNKDVTVKDELISAISSETEALTRGDRYDNWADAPVNRVIEIPEGTAIPPKGYHIIGKVHDQYKNEDKNPDEVYNAFWNLWGNVNQTYEKQWLATVEGTLSNDFKISNFTTGTNMPVYWPHHIDFATYEAPNDVYADVFRQLGKVTFACAEIWQTASVKNSALSVNQGSGMVPFAIQVVDVQQDVGATTWTCDGCNTTFSSEAEALEHQNGRPEDQLKYKCKDCGYETSSLSEKNMHIATAGEIVRGWQCEDCGTNFVDEITGDHAVTAYSQAMIHVNESTTDDCKSIAEYTTYHEFEVNPAPTTGGCGGTVHASAQSSGWMMLSIASAPVNTQCAIGLYKVAWNNATDIPITPVPPVEKKRDPLKLYLFKMPFDTEHSDMVQKYEPIKPTNDARLSDAQFQVVFWAGEEFTTIEEANNHTRTATWVLSTHEENGVGFIDFTVDANGDGNGNDFLVQDDPNMPYIDNFGREGTYWISEVKPSKGFRDEGHAADFGNLLDNDSATMQDILTGQTNIKDGLGYTNKINSAGTGLLYVMKAKADGSSESGGGSESGGSDTGGESPASAISTLADDGISAQANEGHTFWVGDSRFVGLSNIIDKSHEEIIGKVGANYYDFNGTFLPELKGKLTNDSSNTVILGYGVNDLYNVNKYITAYQQLFAEYPNVNFVIPSVTPVWEGGSSAVTNAQIETFNSKMQNAFSDKYVDIYTELKPQINQSNTDGMGVHYNTAMKQKIYGMISNATGGSTGGGTGGGSTGEDPGTGGGSTSGGTGNENEGEATIGLYIADHGELKPVNQKNYQNVGVFTNYLTDPGVAMLVGELFNWDIDSYATWDDTNKKFIYPHDDMMAHEHISLSNLRENANFEIVTELIDLATNQPLVNNGGNSTNPWGSDFTYNNSSAVLTKIYNATTSGTTEIDINVHIDTSVLTQTPDALAGHTLVFVNTVYYIDGETGERDPNAVKTLTTLESEQLRISKSGTELLDKNTGKHITHAIQGRVVYDTIIYENLEPEREYTVKAWLMDKDTNNYAVDAYGTPIVIAQNTVKQISSATGSGEWQIEYNFDAHFYEVNRLNMVQDWLQPGRTYVSFVEVYQGDELVLEYKDINDENETIVIPRIRTELLDDKTGDHVSFAGGGIVNLTDTITYDHMLPGETYRVHTTMIDMDTGDVAIDANGNPIEFDTTVSTTGSEGEWKIPISFDASNLEGHVLVCYEEVFIDSAGVDQPDAEIAHHTDYFDRKQRMYFPYIDTYANDVKTGALIRGETNANANHNAFAEDEMVIQDLVRYEAAMPVVTYTMVSELHYALDTPDGKHKKGDIVVDDNGKVMHMRTVWFADAMDPEDEQWYFDGWIQPNDEDRDEENPGQGRILFQFDGDSHAGYTYVIKEWMYYGEFPMNGEITEDMIQESSDKPYVSQGLDHNMIVEDHLELDDKDQMIWVPDLKTKAYDSETGIQISKADKYSKIFDDIELWNLIPGLTYRLRGTVMDRSYGSENDQTPQAFIDADGKEVTATFEFTPQITDPNDKWYLDIDEFGRTHMLLSRGEMVFTINASDVYQETTGDETDQTKDREEIVIFERLYQVDRNKADDDEMIIAQHVDINDLDQRIVYPRIVTDAMEHKTGTHIALAEGNCSDPVNGFCGGNSQYPLHIIDRVTYHNLLVGYEYSLTATIRNLATGEAIAINDPSKTSQTVTFVAEPPAPGAVKPGQTTTGSVEVNFWLDGKILEGGTYVIYEELFYNGVSIAEHKDENDENQKFYVPRIVTNAKNEETNNRLIYPGETTTITDTVTLTGLIPGRTYTIEGVIKDKDTRSNLYVNNKTVTSKVSIHPDQIDDNGRVTVPVSYTMTSEDTERLAGKTLVVFERVYLESSDRRVMVAMHENFDDPLQTLTTVRAGTDMIDALTLDKLSFAEGHVVFKDSVFYENLIPGRNYSVKGYLVDRDLSLKSNAIVKFRDAHNMHVTVDTQEIADRKTGKGSWEVIYEFDGKDLEGKTLVAYTTITDLTTNEVYYSTELIDKRENKLLGLQDQYETIHFPKIRTLEADIKMSPNSSHFTLAEAECTVTDTVSYENLIAGRWYVMKGQIIDKFSGKPAKDDNGYPITSTYRFRPREASGAVELEYNFDGKLLEGNSYVLYESLYMDGSDVIIAKHEDMEDENQTFYIPKVSTQAWDEYTEMQISVADSVTTIHDKVKLEGLQIGESYTVRGVLMDTDAISATCDQCGETFSNVALVEKHISENRACVSYTAEYTELIPITGNPVTAEYTIPRTESRESMEVELTFDIDTRGLNGKTFVVYEELYHGEDLIGEHRDIADQKQTIYVPTIHTSVVDSVTHQHISKADEEVRLTDTVTYENLEPNRSYVVEGVLMDKSINLPFTDAQGNRITGRTEFIPTSSSGTVNVEFVFNASDLQGKTLVVYETLYAVKPKVGLALIAKHEDINDENQTIHIPKVWSEAYNTDSGNELTKIDKYAKVVDKVFYENLVPGLTYTVEGTIFDLTNQRILKDNRGRDIVFTKTFTPTTANSFVEVEYLINTTKMGNRTYVLYSDIFYDGNSIGEHKDPNDVKEMFAVPRIGTQAIAGDIPEQMTFADNVATIVDTIAYENLTIDREYIVRGILMDKATGKPLLDVHSNQITAQAVLVPETKNGTIEMTFEFDATGFEGKTAVVFESVYFGEAIVAEHEDIEDESQSIHFPRIWSLAQGNETGMTHVGPADSIMTITDRVYFENLIADEAYHIAGTIYDVETGEPAINADGDIVTAQATLNPHGVTSGYQDVVFTFDATGMRGKTLVIFEELYYHKDEFQDYKVAIHNEIDDTEQMIHIPEIGTTAVDSETLDHISKADDTVTIIDTVAYTNLVPDLVYTLRGVLMDKETGEEILDDFGLTVEAMRTFTPTDWDGTVDLTFHDVSMETLAGKTVVVFEYLYYGDTLIEHHDDIEDEEQTIHLPKLQTSAFDFDSQSHNSMSKDHVQIVDEVTYFNLIPGKEYVVKGIMMNKDTGMPVIDADGKQVTGETTFTPETPDGTVDVIFEMNATGMDPASMVVFEELFLNDVSIGEHSDLEDEDQSMYVPWIGTVIVDDDVELQMSFADEEITITDTVKFKNLVVGTHYELIGKLMDKATGKPVLDDNGEEVIGITEFTANVTQGHEFVTFTFSGVNLEGCTLVAYENLYVVRDDEELSIVASHEDINDVDQTIYIPRARTEIVDNETKINYTMADNQVSLTDTISYENLMVGYTYVASGVLVDRETGEPIVDVNGQEIRAEQAFTPTNTMGTVDIVFEFDATGFEGKTFNAFEEITVNGKLVARHTDLTDEKQDIHFPDIHTMIRDNKTEINISNADKYAQIIDTVYYENLKVGEEYIVSGMLINKTTGKPVSRIEDLNPDDIIETWTCDQCGEGFASREEVLAHFDASPDEECYSYTLVVDYEDPTPYVATAKFVAQSASGTVDVVFEFDTTHLEGTTLVAYETLTWNDIVMAEHKDIEDEAQTIYIPKIGTHAVDGETSLNIVNADESVKIVDTVTYTNLIPGTEYILTGKLMNKDTDEFVKDSEGNVITAERVFTPEESDGEVEVIFTFDGTTLENTTLVVFEQLALNTETKPVVAEHEDIEDEAQTIYIPKVETLASEKTTNMNLIKVSDEMATIVDRVETFNLIVGKTYTLNGVLMSKQTGEAVLDSNGNEVTATKTFVAQESRGFVDVEFTFPTKELAGNTLVVFEELLVEGFVVAEHEDINDEDQTVYVPDIGTIAVDSETGDHIANGDETVTIIDTVEYRSLIPGRTYTMSGTLMNKKTGKPITDAEGNVITAEKEFVAEKSDGSIELTFTFDGTLLKGTTVVAFEKCYYEGVEVAVHEDINDEDQSVDIPDIGTTAVDEETQTHHAHPSGETTVIDMVQYTNLTVGKEYTVSGTLMVKSTGKELVDATGKPVTATTTFVAEQKNGSVELRFTFDSSLLEGESVVAFEDLLYNGKVVASHKDINDEDQTVHFAKIGTTAVDGNTKEHMGAAGATTIVDTVAYENLIPGTSYTISGVLMDKETGKEYVTSDDEDAKPYTATVTFVPTEPNGTVELTFNVNAIAGKTIVVFEKAYITGTDKVVAEHEDINDEAQSVGYPEIRTHAYDKDTASNVVSHKKEATVIDTVTYKGLIIGKTYTINGELVDKATGTPTGIKASKTFVAETSDGSVELVFTFDSTRLAGKTLVAFEKLIYEGVEVTNHTDLNDEEQTVYIPDIRTTATDKATGTKTVSYGTDVVITDTVLYTNLVPGKEYEMSGQLVDKSTGKSIGVTASQKFTPDKPNGSVVLEFTVDSTKLVGKTLVAFETLTYKGIEVGVHADLNDEAQTVYVPEIGTMATVGNGLKETYPGKNTEITDTVSYKNLTPGVEYTLVGTLMDKATGKILSMNGKKLTASTTFTPVAPNGTVTMTFTFDSTACAEREIVVFERLSIKGTLVAVHEDINDENQTVKFTDKPSIPDNPSNPNTPSNPNKPNNPSTPSNTPNRPTPSGGVTQTGDNYTTIAIAMSIAIVALGVAIILFKKKKNDE